MIRNWLIGVGGAAVILTGCAGNQVFRSEDEVSQRSLKPIATTVGATVSRETALRSGPDTEMTATQQLKPGTTVTASETVSRGFRRVTTSDGKSGYVDASALQLGAGGGANAAPAGK